MNLIHNVLMCFWMQNFNLLKQFHWQYFKMKIVNIIPASSCFRCRKLRAESQIQWPTLWNKLICKVLMDLVFLIKVGGAKRCWAFCDLHKDDLCSLISSSLISSGLPMWMFFISNQFKILCSMQEPTACFKDIISTDFPEIGMLYLDNSV